MSQAPRRGDRLPAKHQERREGCGGVRDGRARGNGRIEGGKARWWQWGGTAGQGVAEQANTQQGSMGSLL